MATQFPRLAPRKRLYIASGSPYPEALKDYFNDEWSAHVWQIEETYRKGDLALTYIATAPRMFISLSVALEDAGYDDNWWVDPAQDVRFDDGILVDAVANRAGVGRIKREGYYTGDRARKILAAVEAEYNEHKPWFTPSRWRELLPVDEDE